MRDFAQGPVLIFPPYAMRIFRKLVQFPFSLPSLSAREMVAANRPNLTKLLATVPVQAILLNEVLHNDN